MGFIYMPYTSKVMLTSKVSFISLVNLAQHKDCKLTSYPVKQQSIMQSACREPGVNLKQLTGPEANAMLTALRIELYANQAQTLAGF